MNKTNIVPMKAFKDNYIWTLRSATHAVVVDPGEVQPVLAYLAAERLQLAAILATHHHPDHAGGIGEILRTHPCPAYGPRNESIPALTQPVCGGDIVRIADLGVEFSVLDIPGQTRAHIAYYGLESLFCGDTLFACGCGCAFEGTPEQMFASRAKLLALPAQTNVYCGHAYTLANRQFERAVAPANAANAECEKRKSALRGRGVPPHFSRRWPTRTRPILSCVAASLQ